MFFTLTLSGVFALAQDSNLGVSQSVNRLTSRSNMVYDAETAYLSKDWKVGKVIFLDNEVKYLPINYNAFNERLEFQKDNQRFAFDKAVKTFVLGDTTEAKGHLFTRGFQPVDQQQLTTFYEVIYQNSNFKLLKYARFKSREKKGYNEANTSVTFDLYEDFYLAFTTNQLQKLKKSKKEMVETFPKYATEIETFIDSNKLKFKSWEDVIAVLDFVESKL